MEKLNISLTEASQRIISCQKHWRATIARRNFQKMRLQAEQYRQEVEKFIAMVAQQLVVLDAKVRQTSLEDAANLEDEMKRAKEAEAQKNQQQQEQQPQSPQSPQSSQPVQRRQKGTISAAAGKEIAAQMNEGSKKKDMGSIPEELYLNWLKDGYKFVTRYPLTPDPGLLTPDPVLPEVYKPIMNINNPDPSVVFLQESLVKMNTLQRDIWCKIYLMEKNAIVGKLYVKDKEVLLDDSNNNYTGTHVGINSQSFDHLQDSDCSKTIKHIGKGFKLSHDESFNVYLTSYTSLNVYVNGANEPEKNCFPKGLDKKNHKLSKEKTKVFDMEVFKSRISSELLKKDFDVARLVKFAVFSFSVDKCSNKLVDQQFWVAVVHLAALDLLGKNDGSLEPTSVPKI
ncbi:hypothetical protein HELRODRAFT_170489 [Helobdella robusta]|uniref:MH2 domain-containing protein n=1 Tax=Helobdella robusta TaxID=6412 RepID=T1F344_HELRO|nr:hypothetical protein HELRODRAFT_170489 [Helobdella robusta]ESO07179.1 hypothetical protein HELRODRAFT_170489 [Helobdella robusta]